MDLLDFEAEQLYFDEPIVADAEAAIDKAAELYGKEGAEQQLLWAYFLEPEHPLVLVALYRFFYYQHRFEDAMRIAERVLVLFAKRLGLPRDWRELTPEHGDQRGADSMTTLRFYLLALKGAGYLELRLGRLEKALQRLNKVVELDDSDRMGAQSLIDVARYSQGLRAVSDSAETQSERV